MLGVKLNTIFIIYFQAGNSVRLSVHMKIEPIPGILLPRAFRRLDYIPGSSCLNFQKKYHRPDTRTICTCFERKVRVVKAHMCLLSLHLHGNTPCFTSKYTNQLPNSAFHENIAFNRSPVNRAERISYFIQHIRFGGQQRCALLKYVCLPFFPRPPVGLLHGPGSCGSQNTPSQP